MFGKVMGDLGALIASGVVTPAQPTEYRFAEAARALADVESRASIGKLALIP